MSQAITVNLAALLFVIFQKSFKVSLSYIAALTLITFLVQIFVDLMAVKFIEKASYKALSVISQLTSVVGLVALAFLPMIINPKLAIILSVIVYSSGSGLSEVVLSPLMDAIPETNKNGFAMTLMHSFYSWGQAAVILLTTLILGIVGDALWWILPLIWALVPLYNMIMFIIVPIPQMTVADEKHGALGMIKNPVFVLLVILMICGGATEQVMAQWSSYFAEECLGVTKVVGDITGPFAFAVMMGLGRVAHGLFGKRFDLAKLLQILAIICAACFLAIVFAPNPVVALIACGMSGIGVSIMWPGILAYCSSKYKGAGASMFALLALGGDIGCSLGPWLTGFVSDIAKSNDFTIMSLSTDNSCLRAGFLAALVFPLILIVGIAVVRRDKNGDI